MNSTLVGIGGLLCLLLSIHTARGNDLASPTLDILVVAPHPDDEALGCTGVMLQAIEQGKRVGVVVMTHGDGFPRAASVVAKKTEDKLTPTDFFGLAAIRQQHSVGAMGRIGLRAADLMFLGYPDSGLKEIYEAKDTAPYRQKFTARTETYGSVVRDYHSLVQGRPAPYTKASVVADLVEIIKMRKPAEIYSTNEVDTHADHRATFWFVRDAVRAADYRGKFLTYVVHGKPPPERGIRIILTEKQMERKRAVIQEYQAKLSPIHDTLAEKFTKAEEIFWPIRIE